MKLELKAFAVAGAAAVLLSAGPAAAATTSAQARAGHAGTLTSPESATQQVATGASSASASAYADFDYQYLCGFIACFASGHSEAAAYADLATGALGARALADPGADATGIPIFTTNSSASMSDELTFTTPGTQWVPFSVTTDGAILSDGTQVRFGMGLGNATVGGVFSGDAVLTHDGGGDYSESFSSTIHNPGLFHLFEFGPVAGAANQWRTSGEFLVANGETWQLSLSISTLNQADFFNTSTFRFGDLGGATFTSESGVFLTDAGGAAVPEPAAWAMMIAGFVAVGAVMRRRRPAQA